MSNTVSENNFLKTMFIDSNYPQPKKIVFELSDCGTFYNTCIYTDFTTNAEETYEGYIKCKMTIRNFINSFDFVIPDNKEDEVFRLVIPE